MKPLLLAFFLMVHMGVAAAAGFTEEGLKALEKDDPNAALGYFQQGAESGEAESAFRLGQFYLDGQNIEKNEAEAAGWLRQAAESNHAGAALALSRLFIAGKGVRKDVEEGARWLTMSALAGNQEAAQNLARLVIEKQWEASADQRITALFLGASLGRGDISLKAREQLATAPVKLSAQGWNEALTSVKKALLAHSRLTQNDEAEENSETLPLSKENSAKELSTAKTAIPNNLKVNDLQASKTEDKAPEKSSAIKDLGKKDAIIKDSDAHTPPKPVEIDGEKSLLKANKKNDVDKQEDEEEEAPLPQNFTVKKFPPTKPPEVLEKPKDEPKDEKVKKLLETEQREEERKPLQENTEKPTAPVSSPSIADEKTAPHPKESQKDDKKTETIIQDKEKGTVKETTSEDKKQAIPDNKKVEKILEKPPEKPAEKSPNATTNDHPISTEKPATVVPEAEKNLEKNPEKKSDPEKKTGKDKDMDTVPLAIP
ncbi:MAG: hypothetical protein ACOYK8_09515 [Alphaproteobacteria bacterium]